MKMQEDIDRQNRTDTALESVKQEREEQHLKWGTQRHDWSVWLTVLAEEQGELAQQILAFRARWFAYHENPFPTLQEQERFTNDMMEIRGLMRTEAVQVAAVAVALIEHIDNASWR
jgi:hypothetical protein